MAYFDRRDFAPTESVNSSSPELYPLVFKRFLDLVAVVLLVLPVGIVVTILAALVALDGKSPFYLQRRVGRNGREFRIVKLRSMVSNADEILEEYLSRNAEARAEWNEKQKLHDDPRITRIGCLLRKTSMDELPQLWNVMKGEMSLVGPRPMMPCQKELYPGTAYYEMRPGITGPWQVSERNQVGFAQRAQYDDQYLQDIGLGTDLSILAKTVKVVLNASGR